MRRLRDDLIAALILGTGFAVRRALECYAELRERVWDWTGR